MHISTQSINQSICQSINQAFTHPLNQSINQSQKSVLSDAISLYIHSDRNGVCMCACTHQTIGQFVCPLPFSVEYIHKGQTLFFGKYLLEIKLVLSDYESCSLPIGLNEILHKPSIGMHMYKQVGSANKQSYIHVYIHITKDK